MIFKKDTGNFFHYEETTKCSPFIYSPAFIKIGNQLLNVDGISQIIKTEDSIRIKFRNKTTPIEFTLNNPEVAMNQLGSKLNVIEVKDEKEENYGKGK